uniref:Dual specificity protein phosphatase n=1 Tax=Steinernema glaseri TaxID=37863 RepID=A0A1I7Y1U5_9BILA
MDSLKDRIRSAKQNLRNVDVTVTDVHGFEVIERRREDGRFETPSDLQNQRRRVEETRRHRGFVLVDLEMAKCGERLYVGSEDVARSWEILERYGVTHVVNCASRVENWFPCRLEYLQVHVVDILTANIKQHFPSVLDFMRRAIVGGGTVFVHCNAGISRSTTFVIAYLMKFEGLSYEEALAEVRKTRAIARPNDGFARQLKEFEEELVREEGRNV